jgi:hypothetical protein
MYTFIELASLLRLANPDERLFDKKYIRKTLRDRLGIIVLGTKHRLHKLGINRRGNG